ncbi:endonuclease/exonuclease/phosphatase family protein [Casimicrobium huifangae]|jgi:endonuclease/exonuclease/phosphatase family metal-dependent hydrolase|uniref:endonuclease/exonuclease/phosphatase family protein n=1 Tax=Casimicrobium huifangae TaxID=2591109 RepID=UPI0012EC65FF|nr:endonuclease/exonuclease/phosphatase family protein [Casimicrobium huifangae]
MRVAWFNVENLFTRYAFGNPVSEALPYDRQVIAVGVTAVDRGTDGADGNIALAGMQRDNTARVILDMQPDVLGVSEVENLAALRIFNQQYLSHYFDRIFLVEGNDGRGIDVGICVRKGFAADVLGLRTHAHETLEPRQSVEWGVVSDDGGPVYLARNALFSRDCLELDLRVNGQTLTFMANHFKSQGKSSRRELLPPDELRTRQATRVAELVKTAQAAGKLPIVFGDLNVDDTHPQRGQSLAPLMTCGLQDSFADLPRNERWTHYYVVGQDVSRLDYILHDPRLKRTSRAINRRGITLKCRQYDGERYPTVGYAHNAASDHAGLCVEFSL